MVNKLLLRQLKKHLGKNSGFASPMNELLKSISESYDHYENELKLFEHAIETSSKELIELNCRLTSDVEARKKAEVELLKTNQRLTNHLENTPLAVIEWDKELLITQWTDKAEDMFGWKKEDVIGKNIALLNMVYEEDIPIVAAITRNLTKGGSRRNFNENRNRKKNGEVITCEWYNSSLKDAEGQITSILSLVKDISERKKNERELQTINSELNLLFENIDEILFSADITKNKIIHISAASEKIYGYKPAEFYTNPDLWLELIHPADKQIALHQLNQLKAGHEAYSQYRIIRKDKGLRWIENKVFPTCDKHGELIRIDGLTRDVTDRIQNEKRIKESNERFELVTRATNDAIWDWNFETNHLYWSEGYEKLFGYKCPVDNLNIHIWVERIFHEDLDRVIKSLWDVINDSGKDYWESEYRYVRADGNIAHVYDRGFLIYNEKGQPQRMVGAMQDISKRKTAEEYLQNSEAKLRTIFENTDTAYVLLDLNANVISFNSLAAKLAMEQKIGPLSEGTNYIRMMREDRRADVSKVISKVLKTRKALRYEVKYEYEDAMPTWLFVSVHPIFNQDKIATGLSIATTDITSRKLAEKKLQKSEANLRTIFDNANISYVLLDETFKIVSFNQKAAVTYKKELDIVLTEGLIPYNFLPSDNKKTGPERHNALLNGEKINYEISFASPTQGIIWYEVNMYPVQGSNREKLGIILATEDITTRKNAELEKEKITLDLIQRNKDLEQFAYIISHNLRSPVANIIGLSDIITRTTDITQNDYKRCIDGLSTSVKKLDNIIIDLNYILQVRREINEKKEKIRFADLVNDIEISINNIIARENVTIVTNFSAVEELFTLKSYLNSIFYNLISNSIKYRSNNKPPIIKIESEKRGNKILLTFKDNGLGIDTSLNKDKVFGLYKKFHPHIEGKGMGLYMVKTQVEILGGKIDLMSAVDKGTKFMIEFDL